MSSLHDLIESRLADPQTSWSVGCFGAIAEFHWTRDEESRPAKPLGRETPRGSITIDPQKLGPGASGLAWESAGGHGRGWTQGFVVHIPSGEARMAGRHTLARIGGDDEGTLYDIGIGAAHVDVCVVTRDRELISVLDRSTGRSIWEEANPALSAIKEASPARLFRSKAADVRVRQHIGGSGRPTPTGPHTHVLQNLLRTGRPHDARIPVPPGRSVVLSMYPPHPTRDELGRPKRFEGSQWEAFQSLLGDYGPPRYASAKRALFAEASGSGACPTPADPGLARVLLPQLAHLELPGERLDEIAEAWNLRHILDAIRTDRVATSTIERA